jgi:hypothetical protein
MSKVSNNKRFVPAPLRVDCSKTTTLRAENGPSGRFSQSGLLLKESIFFTGGNLQAPTLYRVRRLQIAA